MLSEIIKECSATKEGIGLHELAQKLGKEPAVVKGMLELLLCMGKLVEVQGQEFCETCSARSSCMLIPPSKRTYTIPQT